jgi:phosphopantothenoylcysteine decarboxylase / phosphopantothenate---cysteine ligase
MNYLVTAGPTREFLDDVRFLSNASTGRMGCAVAQAAHDAGHRVTLVCGPVACELPDCTTLIPVVSAQDMYQAVIEAVADADVVVMAAAVADYRPAQRVPGKIKKTDGPMTLELERTDDIAAQIGIDKAQPDGRQRIHIGFALEAANGRDNALRKLRDKHFDLIVLNGPAAMGSDVTSVELLRADGTVESLDRIPKTALAAHIVTTADTLAAMR